MLFSIFYKSNRFGILLIRPLPVTYGPLSVRISVSVGGSSSVVSSTSSSLSWSPSSLGLKCIRFRLNVIPAGVSTSYERGASNFRSIVAGSQFCVFWFWIKIFWPAASLEESLYADHSNAFDCIALFYYNTFYWHTRIQYSWHVILNFPPKEKLCRRR